MLYTAFQLNTPSAVRYPRGTGPGVAISTEMRALPIGKGELRRDRQAGGDPGIRHHAGPALAAAEQLDATVANMRFVKPLDAELVLRLAREHELLVTVEENTVQGGAGSAVAECLLQLGIAVPLLQLGLPDRFIEQGEHGQMLADCGLDAGGIDARLRQSIQNKLT